MVEGLRVVKPYFKEQARKQENKSIFYKTSLTKIPSFKQAYRSKVFRTCTVVLGHHSMHFRFVLLVNLVHASWNLKETVALLIRPKHVHKLTTLLPMDYYLIPGNGTIKIVE